MSAPRLRCRRLILELVIYRVTITATVLPTASQTKSSVSSQPHRISLPIMIMIIITRSRLHILSESGLSVERVSTTANNLITLAGANDATRLSWPGPLFLSLYLAPDPNTHIRPLNPISTERRLSAPTDSLYCPKCASVAPSAWAYYSSADGVPSEIRAQHDGRSRRRLHEELEPGELIPNQTNISNPIMCVL